MVGGGALVFMVESYGTAEMECNLEMTYVVGVGYSVLLFLLQFLLLLYSVHLLLGAGIVGKKG